VEKNTKYIVAARRRFTTVDKQNHKKDESDRKAFHIEIFYT
jgi:hypothetical protein